MKWLIQEDIHAKNARSDLPEVLKRLGIEFELVTILKGRLEPEPMISPDEHVIINGSIMLSRIAKDRGWSPGGFLNDSFDYQKWAMHYAGMILNKDAIVRKLSEAKVSQSMFVRPVLDTKSFNGRVFEPEAFEAMRLASIERRPGSVNPDIEIMMSSPKHWAGAPTFCG